MTVLLARVTHILLLFPLFTLPLTIFTSLFFLQYVIRYTLPTSILTWLFTVTGKFPYRLSLWNLFSLFKSLSNNSFLMQCILTTIFCCYCCCYWGSWPPYLKLYSFSFWAHPSYHDLFLYHCVYLVCCWCCRSVAKSCLTLWPYGL